MRVTCKVNIDMTGFGSVAFAAIPVAGCLEESMIVCVCRAVSDRVIRRAVEAGASTVRQVGAACGAGTCCGACKPQIAALLRGALPIAAPQTACAQDDCAAAVPGLASSAA